MNTTCPCPQGHQVLIQRYPVREISRRSSDALLVKCSQCTTVSSAHQGVQSSLHPESPHKISVSSEGLRHMCICDHDHIRRKNAGLMQQLLIIRTAHQGLRSAFKRALSVFPAHRRVQYAHVQISLDKHDYRTEAGVLDQCQAKRAHQRSLRR